MERLWKEYWIEKEKGRVYFEEEKRELEHKGKMKESMFLFGMRSGHRRMRGTRYWKGNGLLCECRKRENRDHVLLR